MCNGGVLPVFLYCLAGVFTENDCWCGELGNWDGLEEGRLEEK